MKLFTKITLSLISSVFLMGCDSGPLDTNDVTNITESDENVATGEVFTFTNIVYPANGEYLDQIRMTSNNVALISDVAYTYSSTGLYTASITGESDGATNVEAALTQLLSSSNASNSEIRSLLLVTDDTADEPTFTDAEFNRLIELLNADGAGVLRNPDGTLEMLVTANVEYTLTTTSTLAERASGIVSGRYAMESSSYPVVYNVEYLSDDEGNVFSFFIPTVSTTPLDSQLFEQGTFTLELIDNIGL